MLSRERHPYRLRRIDLKNFKSVDDASVELGPLTVVVGANSSGKSTLLQAVLAVAQAVRDASSPYSFQLNGEFLDLGTYRETRNFQTQDQSEPMRIGFGIVDEPIIMQGLVLEPEEDDIARRTEFDNEKSGQDLLEGIPEISRAEAEATAKPVETDTPDWMQRLLDAGVREMPRAEAEAATAGEPRLPDESDLIGPLINLDWSVGLRESPEDRIAEINDVDLAVSLYGHRYGHLWEDELRGPDFYIENPDRKSVYTLRSGVLAGSTAPPLPDRRRALLPDQGRGRGAQRFAVLEEAQAGRITHSRVETTEVQFDALSLEGLVPTALSAGRRRIEERWVNNILDSTRFVLGDLMGSYEYAEFRHLPPLRERRGEDAAKFLYEKADLKIRAPLPDGETRETTLAAALNMWLDWFGLADHALVEDHDSRGLELRVRPKGAAHEVNLTSLGVGVSQALPVILFCLVGFDSSRDYLDIERSFYNKLLIVEQPELHLHPAMQQKMADFLLIFVRSGYQILVETHSEHLVNRLRTQVAADDTNQTGDLVKLLFAEQSDGITSYRESEINEYGGLSEDWPDGFLDLSAKSAQDLVRQSLNKRLKQEESS